MTSLNNEHVWEWFFHVYQAGEDGFKRCADKCGLSRGAACQRLRAKGFPKKIHASTRKKLSGIRAINELKRRWMALIERARRRYVRPRTCMERYYANHEANKERSRVNAAKRHERLKHTGAYKIKSSTRNTVARIARMTGSRRKFRTRTLEFLGCDYPTARAHIEAQFKHGMAWTNHGTIWEIDHIKPLASFNLLIEAELLQAMHYTNLQPLWKADNRAKSDRYTDLRPTTCPAIPSVPTPVKDIYLKGLNQ